MIPYEFLERIKQQIGKPTLVVLFIFISLCKEGVYGEDEPILSLDKASLEVAEAYEFEDLKVTAQHNPVTTPIPTVSAKITQEELRSINMANPEDGIKYMPNLFIRKRFIGDRNGVLSIRGSSVFQSARELVLVDGVTISNLIENRWNGAPKWQIVAPEEIVTTEIMYGPYSALYGGNSMNGVINISTRQPVEQEVSLQISRYLQTFDQYSTDDSFTGEKMFLSYGDKIGNLSFYGFYQHLENDAHPQDFARKSGGDLEAANGQQQVTGVHVDRDPANLDRFVYGAVSFNETDQDLFKLKTAYEITPDLRLQLTLGYWETEDSDTHVENYLRDEDGNTVWSGTYQFNGKAFTVEGSDFRLSERKRQDFLLGFTFEGTVAEDWEFQSVVTWYDIIKDEQHRTNYHPEDPNPNNDGRFRDQKFGDTYWTTYDLKLGNDSLPGLDTLGFYAGFHFSKYQYEIEEIEKFPETGTSRIRNDDAGKTNLYALFTQADWNFLDAWKATLGLRQEFWEAKDGHDNDNVHPDRDEADFSPKFSLSFEPNEDWQFRVSLAKAVRYPIVTEIFIGNPDERSEVVNNPELKPEESFSKTFIVERRLDRGFISIAYFHNDEEDTIFNRRVLTDTGSTTTFVNIEEVETQGVELAIGTEGLFLEPLDLSFSVAYNDTEIEKLGVNLVDRARQSIEGIEGNELPRVPEWRLSMLTNYRITDAWQASIGMRYADGSFDDLENSEDNHDTYEGISSLFVWDFKTSYTFYDLGLELAFGIDNFTDDEYYMHHPFPRRSFYFDAKWSW